MTDPFAHDLAREAREQLSTSARRSMRYGAEPHDWLAHHAAQWALDAVTQREVDAVIAYVWGIDRGYDLTGAISMARTAARGVRNVSDCGTL